MAAWQLEHGHSNACTRNGYRIEKLDMSMPAMTQVGSSTQRTLRRDATWRIDASDKMDCPSWKRVDASQQRDRCGSALTPQLPGTLGDGVQPFFPTFQPLPKKTAIQREWELVRCRDRFTQCCRPFETNMENIGWATSTEPNKQARSNPVSGQAMTQARSKQNVGDEAVKAKQSRCARTVIAEAAKERENSWSEASVVLAFDETEPLWSCALAVAKACRKSSKGTKMLPVKAINPSDPVWGDTTLRPHHKVAANFHHHAERLSDLSLSTCAGSSAPSFGHSSASVVGSLSSGSTSSAGPLQFDISTDDLDEEEASYFPE